MREKYTTALRQVILDEGLPTANLNLSSLYEAMKPQVRKRRHKDKKGFVFYSYHVGDVLDYAREHIGKYTFDPSLYSHNKEYIKYPQVYLQTKGIIPAVSLHPMIEKKLLRLVRCYHVELEPNPANIKYVTWYNVSDLHKVIYKLIKRYQNENI